MDSTTLLAATIPAVALFGASVMIGFILLLAGWKVIPAIALVVGALIGWGFGIAAQVFFLPNWPWFFCALACAVLGALVGIAGLRLLVASGVALFGAIVGLLGGSLAVAEGAVPPAAVVTTQVESIPVETGPNAAARAILDVTAATLSDGLLLQMAARIGPSSLEPQVAALRGQSKKWWDGLDGPSRTTIAATTAVGASMGFLAGLLFSKMATALLASMIGGYLVASGGWPLLAHFSPGTAPVPVPLAWWWMSFALLVLVGLSLQLHLQGVGQSSDNASQKPTP
ncbi:MAG: hypothetical protein O2800_06795 [Planctomycetota bacterium]|nr:hypothetical protein [Planctomycetota bacterium]